MKTKSNIAPSNPKFFRPILGKGYFYIKFKTEYQDFMIDWRVHNNSNIDKLNSHFGNCFETLDIANGELKILTTESIW